MPPTHGPLAAPVTRRATLALLASSLGACAMPPAADTITITGTATYRERMALPPGAVFEVSVRDVSLMDAPSVVMASLRRPIHSVPQSFSLAIERRRLDPRARYSVHASIRSADERLLFITDQSYPVINHGGGTHADLVLVSTTRPR